MLIDKDDPEQSHFIHIYDLDFLKQRQQQKLPLQKLSALFYLRSFIERSSRDL